ncbi:MAG: hypothetical protein JSV35_01170 [Candidatus Bathyarchaeota archaeon]|nr:MAG: hypothetical protein JSV35_01170 [Candidatus Bathyarchaeota archaeon]
MQKKLVIALLVLSILIISATISASYLANTQPTPTQDIPLQDTILAVEPNFISEPIGTTFTVNITLTDVEDLFGLAIEFEWDPVVLGYVDHLAHIPVDDYPDGVLNGGILWLKDDANDVTGFYELGCSSFDFPTPPSFNGSGIVFDMTFEVLAEGISGLDFVLHDLPNSNAQPIPHQLINGTFDNRPSVEEFELVIAVDGSGSTSPAPGTYMYEVDTIVPVDALPAAGWMLDHWELDSVDVGAADPYEVTMDANHTLTAFFVEEPVGVPDTQSTNSTGEAKDTFLPDEHVYASGDGFDALEALTIYVVPNGGPYTAAASIANVAAQATGEGALDQVDLGIFPPGEYDFWIDRNSNGELDEEFEPVDTFGTTSGFFVIPELWLGPLLGVVASFAAFIAYTRIRRTPS